LERIARLLHEFTPRRLTAPRKATKYGKNRPYWLWLSIPFGLTVFLTFLAPDLSPNAKLVYALITYIITGMVYTGVATPITAILPNLTNNSTERVRLNSWRSNGGMFASCSVFWKRKR
jgi:Na+/melibiose symporter-like transporter